MKHVFSRFRNAYGLCLWPAIAVILLAGCVATGKPQHNVDTYILNYPAPSAQNQKPLAVSLKFNRFSIAAAYNTAGMIFRGNAYSIDSFNYSRWAINPADMIADDLLRDLRASGLFQAAFSRYDTDDGRYVISGGIEEFYLKTDGNARTAVISLVISLTDANEIRTSGKLLFQKKYRQEEPLQESSPQGYARAASLAMQSLSGQIRNDILNAIQKGAP